MTFTEAARRAQVMEAAIETVAELGYARASLAKIAEWAGISKSIISYHFSGKEELLERVVGQVYSECGEVMEGRVRAEKTWGGKLGAYISGELDYMRENRARMIAASEIVTGHRTSDGTPLFLEFGVDDLGFLAEILVGGQKAGEFGTFDVRVAAVTITHAVDGALTEWQKDEALDLGAYGEELISFVLRAARAGF